MAFGRWIDTLVLNVSLALRKALIERLWYALHIGEGEDEDEDSALRRSSAVDELGPRL
jgi:hypothetical protein